MDAVPDDEFPPCWLCFHSASSHGPTGEGRPEYVDPCRYVVGEHLDDTCPCQGYVHPGKAVRP